MEESISTAICLLRICRWGVKWHQSNVTWLHIKMNDILFSNQVCRSIRYIVGCVKEKNVNHRQKKYTLKKEQNQILEEKSEPKCAFPNIFGDLQLNRRHGCIGVVVILTSTNSISPYRQWYCEFDSRSFWNGFATTLGDTIHHCCGCPTEDHKIRSGNWNPSVKAKKNHCYV